MTSGHPEDDFSLLIVAACEEGKKVVSAPPPAHLLGGSLFAMVSGALCTAQPVIPETWQHRL